MLTQTRKFAQSPYALVLIVLLVLSFAVWGVSGIFTGSGSAVVIVGNEHVTVRDLGNTYNRGIRRIQRENPQFTIEEARAQGFGDQVLYGLIDNAALTSKARELGVHVSGTELSREIRSIEGFENQISGVFDRRSYADALAFDNFTIPDFERGMREEMMRDQIRQVLTGGIAVPPEMISTRYLFGQESRRMRALILDSTTADPVEDPTDEQLTDFIAVNANAVDAEGLPAFQAPEYRRMTLVRFQVADFERDVEVDEDILRETYEFQVENGQLGTPATRSFEQITLGDGATAEAVAELLRAGQTAEAAAASGGHPAPLLQSEVQSYEIPDTGLADTVFGMQEGEIAAVEGAFGWYAVRVTGAVEAAMPTFEDQLPELRSQAARAAATDRMYEVMGAFEGLRGDGMPLEDAAREAGTFVEVFPPLDRLGRTQDGEFADPVQIPDYQRGRFITVSSMFGDILPAAFEAYPNFATSLEQYNETDFFILRVDEVVESRPRELDEVRDLAELLWRREQVDIQLEARLADALQQLNDGADLDTVAITAGGRVETTTLRRGQDAAGFSPYAAQQAFLQPVGEYMEVAPHPPGEHIILIVDDVIAGDTANAELGVLGSARAAILGELSADLETSLRNALLDEYAVTSSSIDARLRARALGEEDLTAQ